MARRFNGTSDTLEYSGAVLTTPPFTFACWALVTSLPSSNQALLCISSAAGGTGLYQLQLAGGVSGKPIGMQVNPGTPSAAYSTAGPAANTWFHAAGWVASTTSRAAYFNGANKGTDTTSLTNPTSLNKTNLGCLYNLGSQFNFFAGRIAEAAVWNVQLADAEIAALARGLNPYKVRPASLIAYWPVLGLLSPEPDLSGNKHSMTVSSPSAAAHAPLTTFTPKGGSAPLIQTGGAASLIFRPRVVRPLWPEPQYLE